MVVRESRIKKVVKALMLTVLISCSAQAEAPKKKKDFTHDFTVGLESENYQYSESTPEYKHAMHFKGLMGGVNGVYQLTYKDNFFIRPEARLVYGYTNYWSDGSGEIKSHSIPSKIIETRLLTGVPLKVSQCFTLSPYSGIGYRNKWDNDAGKKTTTGHVGYKRKNELWYIPIGFRFKYDFNEQWNLYGLAEYDFLLSGRNYSYTKIGHVYPIINKQTQGKGLKGELLIGRQFEKFSVSGGVYTHYWKIKKSNTLHYHYQQGNTNYYQSPFEPKNVTTEIGLKLTLGF